MGLSCSVHPINSDIGAVENNNNSFKVRKILSAISLTGLSMAAIKLYMDQDQPPHIRKLCDALDNVCFYSARTILFGLGIFFLHRYIYFYYYIKDLNKEKNAKKISISQNSKTAIS